MKMAKASEADIEMAMDVANVLDDIERGYFPCKFSADPESEGIEWIDFRDSGQYQRLVVGLHDLLDRGSISRVIWGMAVVCDPSNECIDPDASTIEHHPKRQELEKQRDELLAALDTTVKAIMIFRNEPALERLHKLRRSNGYGVMQQAMDIGHAALESVKGGAA